MYYASSSKTSSACSSVRTSAVRSSTSHYQQHSRRNHNVRMLTTSLFVLGAVTLPQGSDAFINTASLSTCNAVRPQKTHPLFYSPMPDLADMRAAEMKNELESYGINTKTMFDKRDFEEALLSARKDYEQTLKDCMSNTPFSGGKKAVATDGIHDTSTDSFTNASPKKERKRTVNYDRSNPHHFHERERMWDMNTDYESRNGPDPVDSFETDPRSHYHPRDPYATRGRRPRRAAVETDPLFAHEAQYAYGGGPPPPPHDYAGPHTGRRRVYNNNGGGGGPPPPPPPHANRQQREPQYNDPATQMKYHAALEKSYGMKVEDLQKQLNERGISTKYCMVLADFCVEYAKAVAEGKQKVEKVVEDEDYDPSYRDVVMEPYDPNKFF